MKKLMIIAGMLIGFGALQAAEAPKGGSPVAAGAGAAAGAGSKLLEDESRYLDALTSLPEFPYGHAGAISDADMSILAVNKGDAKKGIFTSKATVTDHLIAGAFRRSGVDITTGIPVDYIHLSNAILLSSRAADGTIPVSRTKVAALLTASKK